jgi:hypothetical protein
VFPDVAGVPAVELGAVLADAELDDEPPVDPDDDPPPEPPTPTWLYTTNVVACFVQTTKSEPTVVAQSSPAASVGFVELSHVFVMCVNAPFRDHPTFLPA